MQKLSAMRRDDREKEKKDYKLLCQCTAHYLSALRSTACWAVYILMVMEEGEGVNVRPLNVLC